MQPVLALYVEYKHRGRKGIARVEVEPSCSFASAALSAKLAAPAVEAKLLRLFLVEESEKGYTEKFTLWFDKSPIELNSTGERWWNTFMRELQEQRETK